ncbi:c-type heme family protein [Stieleria varia]|uniref:Tll0287-like domain-containing protein n=1 Tax=Stieleria varia TaxID=2528005 RepID=A0A5C6B770_9BACT|nr:DUF3365 domain-containing protein [Stieleria varia]TWU07627.1 hypothetical protein Pla52n_02000 [Stieleria varia]
MKPRLLLGLFFLTVVALAIAGAQDDPSTNAPSSNQTNGLPDASEARMRAKMLHELVRGTLQIMHRDFFDEENAHAIPSASLEDVFHEMAEGYDVRMKWLVVNTDVVNIDHVAKTEFEKSAVQSLAAGKPYAERIDGDQYSYAGPIRLGSQCLKCHVKRRNSNEDRTAGLIITMPLNPRQDRTDAGFTPE